MTNLKPEKVERRGKYPGTKIHLGPEASQLLIDLYKNPTPAKFKQSGELCVEIGKKLNKLMVEFPDMLETRTPEQIKAELENEFESAKAKLEAMALGADWKKVKVEVKV